MYKKLLSISVLNAFTAGINMLSSYVIVKFLSLAVFGQFAVFTSAIAFAGVIFSIIPSNFSIFKIQDDNKFKNILLSYFVLISLLFAIITFILIKLNTININFFDAYFFCVTTFFLGIFDIIYQATGKLKKYFTILFFLAVLKLVFLGLFYYLGYLSDFIDLVRVTSIVQGIVIFSAFILIKDFLDFKLSEIFKFKKTVLYIKDNFKNFRPYYVNTALKRIRENAIVLIFSHFTSNEVLGLYSIFVKINSFVFGLSRTLEAFFMNRTNIEEHKKAFYDKVFYFAFVLQIIYLITGLVYLKIFVDNYYFIELLLLSLMVYPYVFFLLARSEMLSNYRNLEANFSEILYIIVVLIGCLISFSFYKNSIYALLSTFILANLGLQIFMIVTTYKSKIIKKLDSLK